MVCVDQSWWNNGKLTQLSLSNKDASNLGSTKSRHLTTLSGAILTQTKPLQQSKPHNENIMPTTRTIRGLLALLNLTNDI
jgi:hypothetical protein